MENGQVGGKAGSFMLSVVGYIVKRSKVSTRGEESPDDLDVAIECSIVEGRVAALQGARRGRESVSGGEPDQGLTPADDGWRILDDGGSAAA